MAAHVPQCVLLREHFGHLSVGNGDILGNQYPAELHGDAVPQNRGVERAGYDQGSGEAGEKDTACVDGGATGLPNERRNLGIRRNFHRAGPAEEGAARVAAGDRDTAY